jgi:hypothetical protein
MKETIKTIIREYDGKGNMIKETENITEKEYKDYNYISTYPTAPYTQPNPFWYDTNKLTCDCKINEKKPIENLCNTISENLNKIGIR